MIAEKAADLILDRPAPPRVALRELVSEGVRT